jgi:hypothetical protein
MDNPPRTYFGSVSELRPVAVNASDAGDNILLAAVPGRRIAVLYGDLVAAGAVTISVEAGDGTVLDGPFAAPAAGWGKIYPQADHAHFVTPVGESLVLDLSAGVQVGGHLMCGLI